MRIMSAVLLMALAGCGSAEQPAVVEPSADLTLNQVCARLFSDPGGLLDPMDEFLKSGGLGELRSTRAAIVNLELLADRAPEPLRGQIEDVVRGLVVTEVHRRAPVADVDRRENRSMRAGESRCRGRVSGFSGVEATP